MVWSYSTISLATNKKNQVRLLIGDTNSSFPILQDEEITFFLTENDDSVLAAAIDCCEAAAAEFSKEADTKNGALSVKASQRSEQYLVMAEKLRLRLSSYSDIFVGGATWSDVNDLDDDPSLIQPSFKQRQLSIFGDSQFDPENA